MTPRYRLRVGSAGARALTNELPEKVAAAAYAFIAGPLLDNPHRVGKPLSAPLSLAWTARRGSYRILYLIGEAEGVVDVTAVRHRADAYRS